MKLLNISLPMLIILISLNGRAITMSNSDTLLLKKGQKITILQGEYTIQYDGLIEDSRCPDNPNYECVWGGNAKLSFKLISKSKPEEDFELNTYQHFVRQIILDSLQINLIELNKKNIVALSVRKIEPTHEMEMIDLSSGSKLDTMISVTQGIPANFQNKKYKIKITHISEDSRCPKDGNCKWAGNVKVHFQLADKNKDTHNFILNTNERFTQEVIIDGITFAIEDVLPAKGHNPILLYIINLKITNH